jgi:hypothetical protein
MDWSRVSTHGVAGLASRPAVGPIRSLQIVESSGHARKRGPSVRANQRKSIRKRHKNGKRNKRTAVKTEVKNKAECTNICHLIASTNNTSTKKKKEKTSQGMRQNRHTVTITERSIRTCAETKLQKHAWNIRVQLFCGDVTWRIVYNLI